MAYLGLVTVARIQAAKQQKEERITEEQAMDMSGGEYL